MFRVGYSISVGQVLPVVFGRGQREEVLLTACQAALCMVLLFNMKFEWWDAVGMFVLWGAQAVLPSLRGPMIWAYVGWIVLEVFLAMVGYRKWNFPLRLGKDSRRFLKAR